MTETRKQRGVIGTELAQLASSSQGAEFRLFIDACRNGRADLVWEAIRRNPEVANRTEGVGVACQNAQVEIVRILVTKYPDLCFLSDSHRWIPLHIAAVQGNEDLISVLLEAHPESIEEITSDNETCFHLAAKHCRVGAFLLMGGALKHDQGRILHMEDSEGNTVLHIAVKNKLIKVIKWLLKEPKCAPLVSLNSKNRNGLTALDIIFQSPTATTMDLQILDLLTKFEAKRGQSIDHSESVQNNVILIDSQPDESGLTIGQRCGALMNESIWMNMFEHSPNLLIITILGGVVGSTYTSALNLDVPTAGISHFTGREIISHPLGLPNGFYSVACITAAFTVSMVGVVFCLWSVTKQWSPFHRALPLYCLALLFISYVLAVEEKVPKFSVAFGSSSISSFALAMWFSMFVILITVLPLGLVGERFFQSTVQTRPT